MHLIGNYGPATIPRLVRIACFAIEEATLPRSVYHTMMYERALQVAALRDGLKGHYDGNRNRRLDPAEAGLLTRQTGLAPKDLEVSGLDGDLGKLLTASYRLRLLPPRITREVKNAYQLAPRALLRALLHSNLRKGMAEYESQRRQMWKEVEPRLAYRYAKPRDYLKWETWRRGGEHFWGTGRYLLWYGGDILTHPRDGYAALRSGLGELVYYEGR